MRYPNGVEARLGDVVQLGESEAHRGVVVGALDASQRSLGFPKKSRGLWGQGILVSFDRLGLVHYREPEPALVLVRRAEANPGRVDARQAAGGAADVPPPAKRSPYS